MYNPTFTIQRVFKVVHYMGMIRMWNLSKPQFS